MTRLLQRMLDKWTADGLTPRPPAQAQTVIAFEKRYNVRLPADFREYFSVCDGMDDGVMDEDLFSFWELSRIRPIPEELPEPEYREYREFPGASRFFCFADWSINGEVFTIELHSDPSSANRIFALGPRPLGIVGFGNFVEAYLTDCRALLG
jgi:hypothetical protein